MGLKGKPRGKPKPIWWFTLNKDEPPIFNNPVAARQTAVILVISVLAVLLLSCLIVSSLAGARGIKMYPALHMGRSFLMEPVFVCCGFKATLKGTLLA